MPLGSAGRRRLLRDDYGRTAACRGCGAWNGYVYRGIALEPQWCWSWGQFPPHNACWHDDESGTYTAVDFNWGSGDDDAWKLAQLWYTGTRQYIKFFALSGSNCNGLRVEFYHDSAKTLYAGQLHYLHVYHTPALLAAGMM